MAWFSSVDYWPAQWLFERALAGIYVIAFLVAVNQFPALLGENGLLAVPRFLEQASMRDAPSLFHLRYSDRLLKVVAWTGVTLSTAFVVGLPQAGPLWLTLAGWLVVWTLYLSIVNVGQIFYGFGWESILLEAGFLAAFLGNDHTAAPVPVILMLRWLLFRLEFGAGLIKMRGDPCWRDLTCLDYHHETQPMPNGLSWYFHNFPRPLHRVEVAANHFAQLVAPFGLFLPQPTSTISGLVIAITQLWLILSGNFSWLNAVTVVLAITAIDGSLLSAVVPEPSTQLAASPLWHQVVVLAMVAVLIVLSYWPVRNMLSRHQLMNFSFNRFHLMGTYGAFGSVTKVRRELVIEGTREADPNNAEWQAYEFKGKPGDPRRRPPQVAPYHLRLDWLMWFIPLSPSYAGGWFTVFLTKLLENDRATLRLLGHNPFRNAPPRWLRVRVYQYRFTTRAERRGTGEWWARTLVGDFMPPIRLHDETDKATRL